MVFSSLLLIKNKFRTVFPLIVFVLIICLWIKSTSVPLNFPMRTDAMDAYSRLFHIVYLPISDVWIAGFQYIMRIFSIIPDNGTFLNYRLGIYIFTLLSSVFVFLIIKKITKSWIYSLFGLVLFLYHPLTVQLSVLTLTEIPWMLFVLASTYFLFFKNEKYYLYLGIMFFMLSQTIRYESWFLVPLVVVYLFIHFKKKPLSFVISTLLIFIVPIVWMLVEYKFYSNPLSFIGDKIKCSHNEPSPLFWNLPLIITSIEEQLSEFVSPYLVILSLLVISFFFKNKKTALISVGTLFLLFCFIFQIYISFNENIDPRFFYYFVPVIAILMSVYLSQILNVSGNKAINLILIVPIFLLVLAEFKSLNQNFFVGFSSDNQKKEEIINSMNLKQEENIYLCLPVDNFSLILGYKFGFKNVLNCNYEKILDPNLHGKLITTTDNDNINNQRKWLNQQTFENYLLLDF